MGEQTAADELKGQLRALMTKRQGLEADLADSAARLEGAGVGLKGPLVDAEEFPRADIDVASVRRDRQNVAVLTNDHAALTAEIEGLLHRLHALERRPTPGSTPQESSQGGGRGGGGAGERAAAGAGAGAGAGAAGAGAGAAAAGAEAGAAAAAGSEAGAAGTGATAGTAPAVPKGEAAEAAEAAGAADARDRSAAAEGGVEQSRRPTQPAPQGADAGPAQKPPREQLRPFALIDEVSENSPASSAGLKVGDQLLFLGAVKGDSPGGLQAVAREVQAQQGRDVTVGILRHGQRRELVLQPSLSWGGRGLLGCHLRPL